MTRKESNIDLLNLLEFLIERHPDMRFGQILQNFGFVKAERPAKSENRISWQNEFYLEGSEILERVQRTMKFIDGDDEFIKHIESILNIHKEKF
jgi:hypothetical protein